MVALYLIDEQTGRQIVESVNFAFCPEMRDLPSMVQMWFDNFNTSDAIMYFSSMNITMLEIQQNMPCSVTYYTTIAAAWQQMVVELFTDGDLCSAYDRYFEKVTKAYVQNCDDSKIEGWLYLVMPDEYDMFVPHVKMAFEYVGKYFYEIQDSQAVTEALVPAIWMKFHATNSTNQQLDVECKKLGCAIMLSGRKTSSETGSLNLTITMKTT